MLDQSHQVKKETRPARRRVSFDLALWLSGSGEQTPWYIAVAYPAIQSVVSEYDTFRDCGSTPSLTAADYFRSTSSQLDVGFGYVQGAGAYIFWPANKSDHKARQARLHPQSVQKNSGLY